MDRTAGYVTPAFVATVGFTLVLLVAVANLLAVHYARGVMQAAAEEGARQAVAVGNAAACHQRVEQVIASGLGGMADGVSTPQCDIDASRAMVSIAASFEPWLPLVGSQQVTVQATVTQVVAE